MTTAVRERRPFFANAEIARVLERSIWWQRRSKYIVYAYIVMPDHLHLLLQPAKGDISRIMQSIKSNSAREINRHITNVHSRERALSAMDGWKGNVMRARAGNFQWQQSFYDHIIIDERDFHNHIHYIPNNPVQAGIVEKPEDYPFLFVDHAAVRSLFDDGYHLADCW